MSGSSIGSVSSSGSVSSGSVSSGSVSSGSVSSGSVSSGSVSSSGSSGSVRNIRLAQIYVLTLSNLDSIIKNKNNFTIPTPVKWNGLQPDKDEILYVPDVIISDQTYNENISVDFSIEQKIKRRKLYDTPQAGILLGKETRKFDHMRILEFLSFIHYPSAQRKYTFGTSGSMFGLKEPLQEELLPNLIKKKKIYKNKDSDNSYWYVLHSTDRYSDRYHYPPKQQQKLLYPYLRTVNPAELEDKYIPLTGYFPTETRLFSSELGLRSELGSELRSGLRSGLGKKRGRSSLNTHRGGKSHRNRRNRRKTAVNRRTTLKQRNRSKYIR
jgi:hypothetical protein